MKAVLSETIRSSPWSFQVPLNSNWAEIFADML